MSHLIENVDGDQLETIALNDLSGLSVSSPSNNQFLAYDSSSANWTAVTRSFVDGDQGFSFYHSTGSSWRSDGGAGFAYSANSGNTPPTELMQCNYNQTDTVVLKNSNVTQYNWGLYQEWYRAEYPRFAGCFVPAGTWYCRATVAGTPYSSAGYAVVRWAKGPASGSTPTTAQLTPVGPNFYHSVAAGRFAHVPTAIIETTGTSTLLCVEFMSGSNYQYGYTDQWLKYYTFHVTRIGD